MNNQFSPELLEKAKVVKSASELITLAKESGITLTEEMANTFYEKLNSNTGELSDEELDNVSGGGCMVSVTGKKVNDNDPACSHWTFNNNGKEICSTCRFFVPFNNYSACFNPNAL